jgi:hypothetical protein
MTIVGVVRHVGIARSRRSRGPRSTNGSRVQFRVSWQNARVLPFTRRGPIVCKRKGTSEALREHVVTVYADAGAWKQRLGVTDGNEDDAFLILVDR